MKPVTPLILLICVIVIAAVSGCVTKNAADLVFTKGELEALGYNVHKIIESDQSKLSGYFNVLDGLTSIHFIEYRMGDLPEEWEGDMIMKVFIFDNEDNSKEVYLSLSETVKKGNDLIVENTPATNPIYKENALGDQSLCYESNTSISSSPFNQTNFYGCVARYRETIIQFTYQCLDRDFEDVKELMAVFETKLE